MTQRIVGLMFLSFAIAAPLVGETPAVRTKPKDTDPPVMCLTHAWNADFKVTNGRYDPARKELSWGLQAIKPGWLENYEAFIADGDGVDLGTFAVKITPEDKQYKKGAKFRAVVPLQDLTGEDAAKMTIRKKN
jgi:hypothetical protein